MFFNYFLQFLFYISLLGLVSFSIYRSYYDKSSSLHIVYQKSINWFLYGFPAKDIHDSDGDSENFNFEGMDNVPGIFLTLINKTSLSILCFSALFVLIFPDEHSDALITVFLGFYFISSFLLIKYFSSFIEWGQSISKGVVGFDIKLSNEMYLSITFALLFIVFFSSVILIFAYVGLEKSYLFKTFFKIISIWLSSYVLLAFCSIFILSIFSTKKSPVDKKNSEYDFITFFDNSGNSKNRSLIYHKSLYPKSAHAVMFYDSKQNSYGTNLYIDIKDDNFASLWDILASKELSLHLFNSAEYQNFAVESFFTDFPQGYIPYGILPTKIQFPDSVSIDFSLVISQKSDAGEEKLSIVRCYKNHYEFGSFQYFFSKDSFDEGGARKWFLDKIKSLEDEVVQIL